MRRGFVDELPVSAGVVVPGVELGAGECAVARWDGGGGPSFWGGRGGES